MPASLQRHLLGKDLPVSWRGTKCLRQSGSQHLWKIIPRFGGEGTAGNRDNMEVPRGKTLQTRRLRQSSSFASPKTASPQPERQTRPLAPKPRSPPSGGRRGRQRDPDSPEGRRRPGTKTRRGDARGRLRDERAPRPRGRETARGTGEGRAGVQGVREGQRLGGQGSGRSRLGGEGGPGEKGR